MKFAQQRVLKPKINAFALPSRDIFVYRGLIDLLEDDPMLSGVLAHEIAHVQQRHAVESVSTSLLYVVLTNDEHEFLFLRIGWGRCHAHLRYFGERYC